MAHHEILMGPRYREWMEDLFNRKHLADDFSLCLHRPTAIDGRTDWQTQTRPYRDRIIQYLERHYLPELSQHIVTEHIINPLYFRDMLNSYKGSAFSVEPTLFQSAWFRPHNQSEDIPNLYCVGAGTHPGAGIPD